MCDSCGGYPRGPLSVGILGVWWLGHAQLLVLGPWRPVGVGTGLELVVSRVSQWVSCSSRNRRVLSETASEREGREKGKGGKGTEEGLEA